MSSRNLTLRGYELSFDLALTSSVEILVPYPRLLLSFHARLPTGTERMSRGDLVFTAAGLPILTVNSLALQHAVYVKLDDLVIPKGERMYCGFHTRQADRRDSEITVHVLIQTKRTR